MPVRRDLAFREKPGTVAYLDNFMFSPAVASPALMVLILPSGPLSLRFLSKLLLPRLLQGPPQPRLLTKLPSPHLPLRLPPPSLPQLPSPSRLLPGLLSGSGLPSLRGGVSSLRPHPAEGNSPC